MFSRTAACMSRAYRISVSWWESCRRQSLADISGVVGGRVEDLSTLLHSGLGESLLTAVSCGSVFMGANTYIGNGPNFMVKSIAEGQGIKMPSFFRYMLHPGSILFPLLVIFPHMFV